MRSTTARGRTDRGAAAVEFAILLPLLFLFLGGIIDFGRYMYTRVTVTNAAREGVRALIANDSAGAATRAQTASPGNTLTVANTVCNGAGSTAATTVSTPFQWFLVGPAMSMVGGSATLPSNVTSTARARCQ